MTVTPTEAPEREGAPPLPLGALATALAAFQAEMPTVTKTKTARIPTTGGGAYTYTYADLADVTAAAMPLLAKNGLAFSATPEEGRQGFVLIGHLLHESGEAITGAIPLKGNSMQDMGSALTYARRYLLGCMTGIVTDDDEDGNAANDAAPTQRQQRPAATQQPPAPRVEADPGWGERIDQANDYDDLKRVYDEAEASSVLEHWLGEVTVKRALWTRRSALGVTS